MKKNYNLYNNIQYNLQKFNKMQFHLGVTLS